MAIKKRILSVQIINQKIDKKPALTTMFWVDTWRCGTNTLYCVDVLCRSVTKQLVKTLIKLYIMFASAKHLVYISFRYSLSFF